MAQIPQKIDGATGAVILSDRSAEIRIAAAVRLEIIRAQEKRKRIPDVNELACAIAPVLEEEMRRREVEGELAGETRVARQYSELLEQILPKL